MSKTPRTLPPAKEEEIKKLYSFYEALAATDTESPKEARKQLAGITRLATEIFRLSCVKHHNMDEAITALYLTGLYHATKLGDKPNG